MARELERLRTPLVPDSAPGLESTDPRLGELADLANRRDYATAADLAEQLVRAGVYDIRALSYLFYQAAFEGGFAVLVEMLSALGNVIGESFEAIGPAKKREEHFDRRIAWIFATLVDALTYHEAKQSIDWERWSMPSGVEDAARAIEHAENVAELLSAGPFENASRSLASFRNWIRAQHERLADGSKPVEEVPKATSASVAEVASSQPITATSNMEPGALEHRVELVASHHFIELCKKLEAFETLIERGEFEKAALVADDVQQNLDSFDPRVYFPDTFSRFSELLAKNVHTVAEYWDSRESVAWKTLGQFYRVNLKGFVES